MSKAFSLFWAALAFFGCFTFNVSKANFLLIAMRSFCSCDKMACRETACEENGCTDVPWEGHAVPIREDNCVPVGEEDGVPIGEEDGVPIGEEDGVPIGDEDEVPIGEGSCVPNGNCEAIKETPFDESCDQA